MREQGEPDSLHTPVQGVGSIPSHHRSVKAAIDLYNAGGDRGRPRLEFHIADHRWTGFYLRTDFPVPPRGRLLLNVKINATMLHERLSAPPTEAALLLGRYPSLSHRTFDDMLLNPFAMWASKRSQVLAPHTRLNRCQPHRTTATGALRPLILFVKHGVALSLAL
jgi:hypothetical protein